MPYLPISPLSPEISLRQPGGASETSLGPIFNVPDGIPGIGGIGSVELPGIGVITGPANGNFSFPGIPGFGSATTPAPTVTATPSVTSVPGVSQLPEVTPFPNTIPQPTATPSAGPFPVAGPSATSGFSTVSPLPSATPTPTTVTGNATLGGTTSLQQPGQGSPYATQPITTRTIPEPIQTPFQPPVTGAIPVKDNAAASTFGKYLKDAVSNYNQSQTQANDMIQRLATGDKVDIHDVTLAVQKASITNQLAIQVRNRLVEAYQQVMGMQM